MWRVSERVYLVDTPGVMVPRVKTPGIGLKLSILGCVKDGIVPPQVVADFLLFLLNKRGFFGYVKATPGLSEPTDDFEHILRCESVGKSGIKLKLSDDEAATRWVKRFRMGEFGRFCLDDLADLENQDDGVVVDQDPDKVIETDERRINRRLARLNARTHAV